MSNKRIVVVGEAWGKDEDILKRPFVGASGCELVRMFKEAGFQSGKTYFEGHKDLVKYCADWSQSEFHLTNLVNDRPPDNDISLWLEDRLTPKGNERAQPGPEWVRLRDKWVMPQVEKGYHSLIQEIKETKPNLIITLGNTSMWALTGKEGITKWRGSQLYALDGHTQVIPALHPAAILRTWKERQCTVQDFRRAARFRDNRWDLPTHRFILRPSYETAIHTLNLLYDRLRAGESLWLSFDIETRAGHIACAGISWTRHDAICIPFMRAGVSATGDPSYWAFNQECEIIRLLGAILTHPKARVIGQNITFDSQYTWKWWGFIPRVFFDTMIGQHSIFSDMSKSLAFICSLYCHYYQYWKDEGKHWDPSMGEEQFWHYNCLDCVYTYEACEVLRQITTRMGLDDVSSFQNDMFWPALTAMRLGTRVDTATRDEMLFDVQDEIAKREQYLKDILGHPLNPDSHPQMHALFYEDFNLPVQKKRMIKGKGGQPTLDDDALMKLANIEPLVRPLVAAIGDIRTLRKFVSNFLTRKLDNDQRFRCSINIGGSSKGKSAPKTYRLSTSESAFDTGANMQNIPSEKSKSIGKAAARAKLVNVGDPYSLPNIRSIFIPDLGYVWIELDLQRADLFVVAYEANDTQLKEVMHQGADIHLVNSFALEEKPCPPIIELIEDCPTYAAHRAPMKLVREFAKVWCHGTNYGGQPPTMAANTGRPVSVCKRAQDIWFRAHPGIPLWHERVKEQIFSRRFIANKLGYRWYIFDRIDSVVPEAIAWIPQSTVSVVINRIWMALFKRAPWIQVLVQVHDALCMQVPLSRLREAMPIIRECARVVVPYDPVPLIIPHSLAISKHSWGCSCDECKELTHYWTHQSVAV